MCLGHFVERMPCVPGNPKSPNRLKGGKAERRLLLFFGFSYERNLYLWRIEMRGAKWGQPGASSSRVWVRGVGWSETPQRLSRSRGNSHILSAMGCLRAAFRYTPYPEFRPTSTRTAASTVSKSFGSTVNLSSRSNRSAMRGGNAGRCPVARSIASGNFAG